MGAAAAVEPLRAVRHGERVYCIPLLCECGCRGVGDHTSPVLITNVFMQDRSSSALKSKTRNVGCLVCQLNVKRTTHILHRTELGII